jgi:hypothetical protein
MLNFRKGGVKMLIRMKKAQNTAEYAILWAIVVAAALAMQHEVRRAIQGSMHAAIQDELFQIGGFGLVSEYEPQSGTKRRTTDYSETETREDPMKDANDDSYLWNVESEEKGSYNASIQQ